MQQIRLECQLADEKMSCKVFSHYSSKKHDYTSNWHLEPEFLLVVSGCENVHIDNETYTAYPGDIVMINSGKIHTITGSDFVHHCVIPSRQILRSIGLDPDRVVFPTHIRDESLRTSFLKIIDECNGQEKKYSRQFRILAIQQFLLDVLERQDVSYSMHENSIGNSKLLITLKVIEYLKQHLSENITLDDISRKISTSTVYMCKCVKKTTGLSIVDHLNQLRCSTAKHYLTYSDKKISEIARLCGYQSVSYFSKVYHKTIGYAPKDTPRNTAISTPKGMGIIL